MTTQEAMKLINEGWILKTHKSRHLNHLVWLKNPIHEGPGCARYITHGVYQNLLRLGIKAFYKFD